MSATIKQIEENFSKTMKSMGIVVEVCCRDGQKWTVFGAAAEVHKAVVFLCENVKMSHESTVHDDELDESFAYLCAA